MANLKRAVIEKTGDAVPKLRMTAMMPTRGAERSGLVESVFLLVSIY